MKKKNKKLALSRETVRNLSNFGLRKVGGGFTELCTGGPACDTVTEDTCVTCIGTRCDTCFTRLAACTEAC